MDDFNAIKVEGKSYVKKWHEQTKKLRKEDEE